MSKYNFILKNKECVKRESILFETELDGKTVELSEKMIIDDLNTAESLIVKLTKDIQDLEERVALDERLLEDIKEANKDIRPSYSDE